MIAKYRITIWYNTSRKVSYEFYDEDAAKKNYEDIKYNNPLLKVKLVEL